MGGVLFCSAAALDGILVGILIVVLIGILVAVLVLILIVHGKTLRFSAA